MNIVFKPSKPVNDRGFKYWVFKSKRRLMFIVGVLSVVFIIGIYCLLFFLNGIFISVLDAGEVEPNLYEENDVESPSIPSRSVIELMADSYGVPAGYMERLAEYISINKSRFGGTGLFSVHQEDLSWIQDKVLLETKLDLTDDMQNAQVAAYLLKRFYDSGYSWRESFLIYTFGFSAIHDSNHQDFIGFVFSD